MSVTAKEEGAIFVRFLDETGERVKPALRQRVLEGSGCALYDAKMLMLARGHEDAYERFLREKDRARESATEADA